MNLTEFLRTKIKKGMIDENNYRSNVVKKPTMVFKVGEGLNPEQKKIAEATVRKAVIPPIWEQMTIPQKIKATIPELPYGAYETGKGIAKGVATAAVRIPLSLTQAIKAPGQVEKKPLKLPYLGEIPTYQKEFQGIANDIIEGKKPLWHALKPFAEVPLDAWIVEGLLTSGAKAIVKRIPVNEPQVAASISKMGLTDISASSQKTQFIKLANKFHPDKVGAQSTKLMTEVNNANDIITVARKQGTLIKNPAGVAKAMRDLAETGLKNVKDILKTGEGTAYMGVKGLLTQQAGATPAQPYQPYRQPSFGLSIKEINEVPGALRKMVKPSLLQEAKSKPIIKDDFMSWGNIEIKRNPLTNKWLVNDKFKSRAENFYVNKADAKRIINFAQKKAQEAKPVSKPLIQKAKKLPERTADTIIQPKKYETKLEIRTQEQIIKQSAENEKLGLSDAEILKQIENNYSIEYKLSKEGVPITETLKKVDRNDGYFHEGNVEVKKLADEYGDFRIAIKDVNGQTAGVPVSEFLKWSDYKEFRDRVREVFINRNFLSKQKPFVDKNFMQELFNKGKLQTNLIGKSENINIDISKIKGKVKLSNTSTISQIQKSKFVETINNPFVQEKLLENGIKEVNIQPPYKFSLSEQGHIVKGKGIINISADATNPSKTILHELGHAKFESLSKTEQAKLIDIAKNTQDISMQGYKKIGAWEEIAADTMYKLPEVQPDTPLKPSISPVEALKVEKGILPPAELKNLMDRNNVYWDDIEKSMERKLNIDKPLDRQLALNHLKKIISKTNGEIISPKVLPQAQEGVKPISKIAKDEKALVQGEVAPRPVPPKLPEKIFPAKPKEIKQILGFGDSYKAVYNKMDKIPSVKDPTTFKKFKDKVADAWLATRELVEDDWVRVKKLIQRKDVKISETSDPYMAEILMHGRMGTRVEEAKDIVIKIDKDILKLSKQLGKKSDDVLADVDNYLIARHAPERNLALGEKAAGITTAEANKIVAQTDKNIIKIADEIQELNNKTLDVLLDGEVIDQKLYDTLRNKYKHHIPLNRIFEDTEDIGQAIAGRPFDVRSTGILRAKGSERKVADVMTNITTNYEQAIIRAEKNRVDLATLKFARDNKDIGLFTEVKPPQIPVAKITHREAIDEVYFKKVIDFTNSLGGKVSTKGQPGRRLGYFRKPSEVVRKTATPREILSHEVGHFLDNKFGLKQRFYKRGETKKVAEEMIGWMEEMGESANRMKKTEERFADSFEWWLTNRALAEERLPLFSREIENIIKDIPELKPLILIKPSGRFTIQGTQEVIFRPSVDKLLKDPTILAMREKGKPVYLKIEDTPLALALRGVNRWKVDGVMRGVQAITRFYSQLATRFNPEFFLPNKVRDSQEAFVYMASKNEFGFKGAAKAAMGDTKSIKSVMDYIRGVDSEGAKLYKQMKMDGGTTGGLGLSTRKNVELDINKIREINRSKPRQAAEMIVRAIDDINTVFEDSTRLSIYKQALKSGATRERAAVLAKEGTINFNKFGKGGPVVNAMYMFANASIQGSAKMLRALRNPKIAGVVITSIGTAVVAVNEWNDKVDKNWRDKISKWDRMNSLPVVFPKEDGGITYFSIPVSWGIKPIKVSMDYAADVMAGREDLKSSISGILASVMEGYNPVGGTNLTSVITPTVLDMPVEIARNLGWYGSKIRPDWDINAPASIQYYTSLKDNATGKTFIQVSKGLSGMGVEISPADMNYAYSQLVGGAGRFVSKVANTFVSIGKGETPSVREIPFVSRFLRQFTEEEVGSKSKKFGDIKKVLQEQSRDKFILNQEAEDAFAQLKNLPKEQKKEMVASLIKENLELAKKLNELVIDENLNLNYIDRLVKQLGVENKERAKYVAGELNKMKTKQEKKDYIKEMIAKKIITEQVAGQMIGFLK